MSHLQIEQNSSYPHGLADFQAVGEEREAWGALVVGWQNLNVNCSDGAPGRRKNTHLFTDSISFLNNLLSNSEVPSPRYSEPYS